MLRSVCPQILTSIMSPLTSSFCRCSGFRPEGDTTDCGIAVAMDDTMGAWVVSASICLDRSYPWKFSRLRRREWYNGERRRRRLHQRYNTKGKSGVSGGPQREDTKAASRPLRANTALTFAILDAKVATVPTSIRKSWQARIRRVRNATFLKRELGACWNEYNPKMGIRNWMVRYTCHQSTNKGYTH